MRLTPRVPIIAINYPYFFTKFIIKYTVVTSSVFDAIEHFSVGWLFMTVAHYRLCGTPV